MGWPTPSHIKLLQCQECSRTPQCRGVWSDYPHGAHEFVPIRIQHPADEPALEALRNRLGGDLSQRPLPFDEALLSGVLQQLEALPPKPLRVLLIINLSRQILAKMVLLLFAHARVDHVDLLLHGPGGVAEEILLAIPPTVHTVDRDAATRTEYDTVISCMSIDVLDHHRIAGHTVLLFSHVDQGYLKAYEGSLERLLDYGPGEMDCYNLFREAISLDETPELASRMRLRDAINWPPGVELFYDAKAAPLRIPYIFIGGQDRDYEFLWTVRHLFKDRTVVMTSSNFADTDQVIYLDRLQRLDNFIRLDFISLDLYTRILLSSRVALLFLRGAPYTDYTSIAEAMWYGKPVIANEVHANRHQRDYLLMAETKAQVATHLERLEDALYYRAVSEKTATYARANNNLIELLVTLYQNL